MFKKKNLIIFIFVFLTNTFVFAITKQEEKLTTFQYISHEVYCFISNCEREALIQNNNIILKKKDDLGKIEKEENGRLDERENNIKNNSDKKEVVFSEPKIIKETKYINTGNTIVKKYYNTIEKTPIINKYYPKEVIETTKKVVENYDDSSLRRQIRNNRSLISQISGVVDSDDLSDNKLSDLGDVDTNGITNSQVLA